MRRIPILAGGVVVVAAATLLIVRGNDPATEAGAVADAPAAPDRTHDAAATRSTTPDPQARAPAPSALVPAPAVVCGLVLTEAGSQPVAGALVALRGTGGTSTVHADEAGGFCFRELAPGRYDLVAQHDGRRSETVEGLPLEAGEELRELALVVRDGVEVAGRILDRRTGEGIGEARIVTACGGGFGFSEAASDRLGEFSLSHVPPGRHRLTVTAKGYADGELVLEVEGNRRISGVSLVLDPEARIGGRVLDAAGDPVAGASVRAVAYRLSDRPDPVGATGEGSVFTEADGTFLIEAPAGVLAVVASAPGHGPGRTAGVEVGAGGRVEGVEVRLTETASLLVDVLLPSGAPAAGARLRALCDGALACGKAEANEAGRAHLEDLAEGRVVVEASMPGEAGRARVPVDVSAGVRRRLTVALSTSATLSGEVTDARGRALQGAVVEIREMGGPGIANTVADGEGRFFAEVPADTPLSVVASTDAGRGERGGVRAGEDVRVVVRAFGRIAGWVSDSAGRPVTDVTVTLVGEGAPGPGGESPQWRRERFASERGDFAFDELTPGTYRLQAFGPGHAPGAEVGVQVWSGAEAGPVRLHVSAAGRVHGRVVSPEGRPVGGARVALEPGRLYGLARFSGTPGAAAESDPSGGFFLDDVPAGAARRVYAWHPDWRAGASAAVAVEAGREAGPVEVRLRPHRRGRGSGGPPVAFGGVGMTVSMDDDGAVRIGEVFAGGPAFLAGVRTGDHILAVDGVGTDVLGLRGTLRSIRGPVGTDVVLRLERDGRQRFDAQMVRVELAM